MRAMHVMIHAGFQFLHDFDAEPCYTAVVLRRAPARPLRFVRFSAEGISALIFSEMRGNGAGIFYAGKEEKPNMDGLNRNDIPIAQPARGAQSGCLAAGSGSAERTARAARASGSKTGGSRRAALRAAAFAALLAVTMSACSGAAPAGTDAADTAEGAAAQDTRTEETAAPGTAEENSGETGEAGTGTAAGAANGTLAVHDDLRLTIPEEYKDLIQLDMTQSGSECVLFSVTEGASVRAAEAQGRDVGTADNDRGDTGPGWLFSIGRVYEETLHQMLCYDMSGAEVIARDADGLYLLYYHPTDVRVERENFDNAAETLRDWEALCAWAASVPESFLADNPELTAETRGNTMPEIYLARAAYLDGLRYTISTTQFGPLESGNVDAAAFVDSLTRNVTYSFDGEDSAPDGQYVALDFPDDDVRLDFFLLAGHENMIRAVWNDGYEQLYTAKSADASFRASEIMQNWYAALVAARDAQAADDAAQAADDAAQASAGAQEMDAASS